MNNMFEEGYTNRLKNQLFKILCLKDESNPIWEKQLDNLLIELNSFDDKNKNEQHFCCSLMFLLLECLSLYKLKNLL